MLVRADARGALEVYLTRRHSRSRFMPDAFVFPGGAIDDADYAVARTRVRGRAGSAASELVVAAVRETFEEAGILLASAADATPAALGADDRAAARRKLLNGGGFATFLAEHDLWLDATRLAYYSNWITPASEPVRFDAHFFMARTPTEQIAAADAMEVYDGVWLAPGAALALAARGEMTIRFPTQKHLERLAAFDCVDAALAAARARVVTAVRPIETGDDVFAFDDAAW